MGCGASCEQWYQGAKRTGMSSEQASGGETMLGYPSHSTLYMGAGERTSEAD